jgi:hypothetical protein
VAVVEALRWLLGGLWELDGRKKGVCRAYNVTALPWTARTACVVAVWMTWHIRRGPLTYHVIFSMQRRCSFSWYGRKRRLAHGGCSRWEAQSRRVVKVMGMVVGGGECLYLRLVTSCKFKIQHGHMIHWSFNGLGQIAAHALTTYSFSCNYYFLALYNQFSQQLCSVDMDATYTQCRLTVHVELRFVTYIHPLNSFVYQNN